MSIYVINMWHLDVILPKEKLILMQQEYWPSTFHLILVAVKKASPKWLAAKEFKSISYFDKMLVEKILRTPKSESKWRTQPKMGSIQVKEIKIETISQLRVFNPQFAGDWAKEGCHQPQNLIYMSLQEKGMCEGKYDMFGMYIWLPTIKKYIEGWLRKKQRLGIYDDLAPVRK